MGQIISLTSAASSTTPLQDLPPPLPLLLLLDVPCPDFRGCSCVTLLVSTKRTADFHSQVTRLSRRAHKCTIDFHLQVNSNFKTCLQMHR